jgi:hypothetical protein
MQGGKCNLLGSVALKKSYRYEILLVQLTSGAAAVNRTLCATTYSTFVDLYAPPRRSATRITGGKVKPHFAKEMCC